MHLEVQLASHLGRTSTKGSLEADLLQLPGRQFCKAYFILRSVFPHFVSKPFGRHKLQGQHRKTCGRKSVFQFQFRFADSSDKIWVTWKILLHLELKAALAAKHRQLPLSPANPGCEIIVALFANISHRKAEVFFLLSQPTSTVPQSISTGVFFWNASYDFCASKLTTLPVHNNLSPIYEILLWPQWGLKFSLFRSIRKFKEALWRQEELLPGENCSRRSFKSFS